MLGTPLQVVASATSVSTARVYNRIAFAYTLYEALLQREKNITIQYAGTDSQAIYDNFSKIIFTDVMEFNDGITTDDQDYLIGNISGYKCCYQKENELATFSISLSYHETKEETEQVNIAVEEAVKLLNLSNKSTYDKIKVVHDYVIKKITYDSTCNSYSAYGGIIHEKTVCNGYALLTYKMLKEAGVSCKYIAGKAYSNGVWESHAWNIVKIGKKWYNMDVTWDDPDNGKQVNYKYFLISNEEFNKNHKREEYYNTTDFYNSYPMSINNYTYKVLQLKDISIAYTKKTLKLKKTSVLKMKISGDKEQIKSIQYKTNKKSVADITKTGKIKAKKAGKATITTTVKLVNGKKKVFQTVITVKK